MSGFSLRGCHCPECFREIVRGECGCSKPEVSPCPPANCPGVILIKPSDCVVAWSVYPQRVSGGGLVALEFHGVVGAKTFPVEVAGLNTRFVFDVTASATGSAVVELQMPPEPGEYTFRPLVSGCVMEEPTKSALVVGAGQVAACLCDGTVKSTPKFSATEVLTGATVTLSIEASNTNGCDVVKLNQPPIALPPQLVGGPVEIVNAGVAGKGSTTFKYLLTAKNETTQDIQAVVVIPPGTAVYECNGVQAFASGGQASIKVRSATSSACAISIEAFDFTPSKVTSGNTSEVRMVVRNVGQSTVTGLNLSRILLTGTGVTVDPDTPFEFSNVTLAPNQSHTLKVSTKFTATNTGQTAHQIQCAVGQVSGVCSGGQVSNTSPISATLLIDKT